MSLKSFGSLILVTSTWLMKVPVASDRLSKTARVHMIGTCHFDDVFVCESKIRVVDFFFCDEVLQFLDCIFLSFNNNWMPRATGHGPLTRLEWFVHPVRLTISLIALNPHDCTDLCAQSLRNPFIDGSYCSGVQVAINAACGFQGRVPQKIRPQNGSF